MQHITACPAGLFAAAILMSTLSGPALSQVPGRQLPGRGPAASATAPAPVVKPCTSVTTDPPTYLVLGKSRVIHLDHPAARLVVGGQSTSRAGRPVAVEPAPAGGRAPAAAAAAARGSDAEGVADTEITLLSPTELFFLGKKTGSMNVVLQSADGRCVVKDIIVTVDPETLQAKLGELLPEESSIKVRGADHSLVLTGTVSDALKLDNVMNLATSYADGKKVVNLLRVMTPQQVMLEVKIAEVSKTLLDRLGLDFSRLVTSANGATSSIISGIIGGGAATLGQFHPNVSGGGVSGIASASAGIGSGAASATLNSVSRGATLLGIDAQKKDGVVRILAEPNIMAISGQAASFLSGGKIYIPVAQNNSGGGTVITLEEKEFGVGLKFTPTVLDGSRINLKLTSEASELSQTGSPFTTFNGVTAILPSITTRRVDTTVQLGDGQSFAIAGLIRNNANEALTKFPGLGEVPVMGALFRSTEFQTDQSELMFVVTPRLVKPLTTAVNLPTDNHIVPSRSDILLMGSGEGKAPAPAPARAAAIEQAPVAAPPAPPAALEPAPVAQTPMTPPVAAVIEQAPVAAPPAPPAAVEPAPVAQAPMTPPGAAVIEPVLATPMAEPVREPAIEATPIGSSTPAPGGRP